MDSAVAEVCDHRGWALWGSHWEAWCGQCGLMMRYPELINVRAHARGDVWNEAT